LQALAGWSKCFEVDDLIVVAAWGIVVDLVGVSWIEEARASCRRVYEGLLQQVGIVAVVQEGADAALVPQQRRMELVHFAEDSLEGKKAVGGIVVLAED